MPSFGRIMKRLRSSLRTQGSELRAVTPPEINEAVNESIPDAWKPEIDLSFMLANFVGNFKGLPQEIVDEILEYLEDHRHRRTLVACSLTCKALFLSARHIIHRQLYMGGTLDTQEIHRYKTSSPPPFHILSAAARCDLTRYARRLTIDVGREFTPQNLWPYHPQFQTFALLTSITLHQFDPSPFLPVFEQHFGHLKRQIRSLEFINPPGSQDDMLYFICQFPTLEDLGFNPFPQHNLDPSQDISTVQNSPTLGGTLRIASMKSRGIEAFGSLARLPSGLRFRSIEFLRYIRIDPNIIMRECASTLQSVTLVFHVFGPLLGFDFSACPHLQVFELRLETLVYSPRNLTSWLTSVISTITSPAFSRFVFQVNYANFEPIFRKIEERSIWTPVDQSLLLLAQRTGAKITVKRRVLWRDTSHENFRNTMVNTFPLMVSAEAVEFELDVPP